MENKASKLAIPTEDDPNVKVYKVGVEKQSFGFQVGMKVGKMAELDLSPLAEVSGIPVQATMQRAIPDINQWQMETYKDALQKGANPGGVIRHEGRCAVCCVGLIMCCGIKDYLYYDPVTNEKYFQTYPCELTCCGPSNNHKSNYTRGQHEEPPVEMRGPSQFEKADEAEV